jgi:hypothetical protein
MNRQALAALVLAAAVALGLAGCKIPSAADSRAKPSWNSFAPCPQGDIGRVKDAGLRWPDQWECFR